MQSAKGLVKVSKVMIMNVTLSPNSGEFPEPWTKVSMIQVKKTKKQNKNQICRKREK
jgi:hypothetical protein